MPVLGNDAGTGGDAGNTTSTATPLPATNGTYYGNLTSSSDTSDYYLINMSSNTGIAVEITYPSSADFDLALLDSGGGYIDLSTNSGTTDDVTSNGTSVGGNSVYIWVDHYSGTAQYTMQIWIFSTGSSGGGGGAGNGTNGHDAGTGTDAGNSQASAMLINSTNVSFWGDVTYSTDTDDYYKVSMPAYFGVSSSLSWNSTADLDLEVYDSSGTMITYSWFSNPETVTVNNYGGSDLFFRVFAYGTNTGSHDYFLSFTFDNMTNAPVNNQDDAGTGGDASNDYLNPTILNVSSVAVNNTFSGWGSLDDDLNDNYQTNVPMGHGIRVSVWFNSSVSDFQVILADDQANTIDYSSANNPELVTSNGSGTYPGMIVEGMDILLQVRATSGGGYYGMSWWFFTLDTDGDSFYDTVEVECGSDPEDNYSVPLDTDSDGICDTLDSDDDGDYVEDANDTFPLDASEWEDTDNDNIGNNADSDDDGDGFSDNDEIACGSDPLDGWNQPSDFDSDGICDLEDSDDDNDGYDDEIDAFPMDDSEWADTDNNGVGDNSDTDDDGDGWLDSMELLCETNPLISQSVPLDTDLDLECDIIDTDDDNDGVVDIKDWNSLDANEWIDTDGDGIGNNADTDDDGDGMSDSDEILAMTNPLLADSDNDGVGDYSDMFPLDPLENYDSDGDGVGDNSDSHPNFKYFQNDFQFILAVSAGILTLVIFGYLGVISLRRSGTDEEDNKDEKKPVIEVDYPHEGNREINDSAMGTPNLSVNLESDVKPEVSDNLEPEEVVKEERDTSHIDALLNELPSPPKPKIIAPPEGTPVNEYGQKVWADETGQVWCQNSDKTLLRHDAATGGWIQYHNY